MVFSGLCLAFDSCNIPLNFEEVEYSGFRNSSEHHNANTLFLKVGPPVVGAYKVIAVPRCKSFHGEKKGSVTV